MRLVILTNATYEGEKALVNSINGEVYARGDEYHNQIEKYIAGIIEGFAILGVELESVLERECKPGDYWFDIVEFTDCRILPRCVVCDEDVDEEWEELDEMGRCEECSHEADNEFPCDRCGEYVRGDDLRLTDHGELCRDCYQHEYEEEE